jgi:hypothetical protein
VFAGLAIDIDYGPGFESVELAVGDCGVLDGEVLTRVVREVRESVALLGSHGVQLGSVSCVFQWMPVSRTSYLVLVDEAGKVS